MTRRDACWMVGLVGALAVVTIVWGERIGVNRGFGWDGMDYGRWARDFPAAVSTGFTRYQAQRVLPSLLVWASGGYDHTIVRFQILDAIAIVAAAFAWTRIAARLELKRAAAWAGFAGIFASFAIARHALYYPTLTDSSAFALGMAMTWAYLTDRPTALWVVAVAGAWTWPALPAVALGLLVLRRRDISPVVARWVLPSAIVIAVVAAALVCIVALHYLGAPLLQDRKWADRVPRDLLWASVPVLGLWTALAWFVLVRDGRVWNLRGYGEAIFAPRLIMAALGTIAVMLARVLWVDYVGTRGPGPDAEQFACELALESLRAPLWDLVHHVVYFGPIILVAIIAWRSVAALAATWGLGAVLVLAMTVAFAIGSESRQWLHVFPFLATAAIAATASWWNRWRTLGFIALCLAWSKLWWPLRYTAPGDNFSWPTQRYFMQQGPWASTTMFIVHAAAAVVSVGVLVGLHYGANAPPART